MARVVIEREWMVSDAFSARFYYVHVSFRSGAVQMLFIPREVL